jgi:hypothetical protein
MAKARFAGYRVWKKGPSQSEQIMVEIKKQTIRDFGRPDVPSVVKASVKNYATDHKVSLKTALDLSLLKTALTKSCERN